MKTQLLRDRAHTLAADFAAGAGLDLVNVEVKGEGSRRIVRIIVDRKGGVDVASCQALSKAVSAGLEQAAEDSANEQGYTLEVSSPGVNEPLADQRAFDRVEGRKVRVMRKDAAEIVGTVRAAQDDVVLLDVDGQEISVAYGDIVKATQALPW